MEKNIVNPKSLKGKDQMNRIHELMNKIAPTINQSKNNSVLELLKKGPDNKIYGIVRENHKYYMKIAKNKKNLNVNDFQYIGGLKNKEEFVYESYSKATKQLKLKFISLAEAYGVEHDEDTNILMNEAFSTGFEDDQVDSHVKDNDYIEEDVPDKHQEKIAKDTVKNPNKGKFMGGPSEEEAIKMLKNNFGYSDKQIKKLQEDYSEDMVDRGNDAAYSNAFDDMMGNPMDDEIFDDNFLDNKIQPSDLVVNDNRFEGYDLGGEDYGLIGHFNNNEELDGAIKKWIKDNNINPNIFYINDHGNISPYKLDGLNKKSDFINQESINQTLQEKFELTKKEANYLVNEILKENAKKKSKKVKSLTESENFDDYSQEEIDGMFERKSFPFKFASWFTSTSLCDVKHPKYGNHQITSNQIKYSSKEYKDELYQSIYNKKDMLKDILMGDSLEETKYTLKVDDPTPESETDTDFENDIDVDSKNFDDNSENDGNDMPFDDDPFDAGVEASEEDDPEKFIQQLSGKLGTTLRKYNKDRDEPDFDLEKFAINSVISATHSAQMDDGDRKKIIEKIKTSGQDDDDTDTDVDIDTDEKSGDNDGESDMNDEDNDDEKNENFNENLENQKNNSIFANNKLKSKIMKEVNQNLDIDTIIDEVLGDQMNTEPEIKSDKETITKPKIKPDKTERPRRERIWNPEPGESPDPKAKN